MLDDISPTTAANGLPWRFLLLDGFAWSEEESFRIKIRIIVHEGMIKYCTTASDTTGKPVLYP